MTHVLCSVGGSALPERSSATSHSDDHTHSHAQAAAESDSVQVQILKNVARMLKPGGRFLFLEHVLDRDSNSWYTAACCCHHNASAWSLPTNCRDAPVGCRTYAIQRGIEPLWSVFGGGCGFEPTWRYFELVRQLFHTLDYHYFEPQAIPLAFVRPHIMGSATK